jgi:hypothetical protein
MSRPPCFECGRPSQRRHYVIPKELGGRQTVPLCAECLAKTGRSALTKVALSQARARGVELGRPRLPADSLGKRVKNLRGEGLTLRTIAEMLNAERVPTLGSANRWTPSTVAGLLRRASVRDQ